MQDHLRPIGLGHEVRSPVGKGRHLVLLAAGLGGDDHGDQGQLRILPDHIQQGIAVHHRHHHIQQDQRNFFSPLPQQVKRNLTVLRLQNIVAFLQDRAQNLPVQLVILHNQNLFAPHRLISRSAAARRAATFDCIFDFSTVISNIIPSRPRQIKHYFPERLHDSRKGVSFSFYLLRALLRIAFFRKGGPVSVIQGSVHGESRSFPAFSVFLPRFFSGAHTLFI